MPTTVHEVLVQAVRDAPDLVATLLRAAGLLEAPGLGDARATLDDPGLPALVSALAADALVVLRGGAGAATKLAVVVEVQLEIDDDKLYTWPSYQAAARYRHKAPAVVVVVCPSERTAEWAERAVSLDGHRSVFAACVFGPRRLAALDVTHAPPELKWLVAFALRDDPTRGPAAFAEATDALASLHDETFLELYCSTLQKALSPAVRAHLEALAMNPPASAPSPPPSRGAPGAS